MEGGALYIYILNLCIVFFFLIGFDLNKGHVLYFIKSLMKSLQLLLGKALPEPGLAE